MAALMSDDSDDNWLNAAVINCPSCAEKLFRVDHSQRHDIRAGWGFIRARPYKGGRTLVSFGALVDISAIKVVAPNVLQMVTDAAIQIHGGEGMSDPELSRLMGMARALRIADGPDEVHRGMVARLELKKYV